MNEKLYEEANEVIKTFKHASFGVIDENGYPSASAISLQNPEDISKLYFTTTMDSNKAKRIQRNKRASVNIYTDMDNITLVGEAEIFSDQETKSKYWYDWVERDQDVYLGGVTDPNYAIIKFTTKRVSLWMGDEGAEFMLD